MVKKTWVLSLILFLVFFQLLSTQAQIIQKKYNINWQDNLVYRPNEHVTIELLYFTGAISDENYPVLPLFYDQFNVDNFFSDYQVTIMGMETKEMDAGDVRLIPGTFEQPSVDVRVKTVIDRKENLAAVTFIPIIKDAGGKFLQITSITLGITPDRSSIVRRDAKSDRTYAANSVLSTGSWYKISTTQTGLHKVAFEDLQALGISATSIPSSQITLFGNGGTILPEANSEFTYDDLQENPIWMHDGGDGTFDSGDYFVFYATAPHVWTYNSNSGRFVHTLNPYCDNVYYFINVDAGVGIGKRVQGEDNSALVADGTATTYTHYTYFEEDKIALVESGRSWLGDLFDVVVEKEYSFTVPPVANKPGSVGVSVGFVNTRARMQVAVNGTNVGAVSYDTSYPKNAANLRTNYLAFTPNSTDLTVKLTYSKPDNSSSAYLDWIELQMICNLSMHSAQFPFTVPETWKENQVTEFVIANANSNTKVWDVTEPVNPVRMIGSLDNGAFIFKTTTDKLRKFVAFNGTSYLPVTVVGKVDNQNLHGDLTVENDMIIVTHPNFLAQANKLAKFRRENDNLKVKVVTIGQVYNEFSSGATDPTAIRNYMRMIYDKTDGAYPKYLLLVGRPSFDYRNRAENSVCYVPNYQVDSKLINNSERANDDYFGLLDWNEGRDCSGQIDLAVGRFPVTSVAQANTAVDKAINYSEKRDLTLGANGTQVSNLADWRNVVTFIADDEDNNAHLKSADSSAELLAEANKIVNIEKIYCDAYQQVSHSGGQRYPDVNTAINNRMERGAFLMAYLGHGGGSGWAEERILTRSDINKWSNKYNQPLLVTLTCEFSWYDRPAISPGELAFLNDNGGAVALLTTSRVAYTGSNETYSFNLMRNLYKKDANGDNYRLGELHRIVKNASGGASDLWNMIYVMGDPSLPLAIPKYDIVTDSINGVSVLAFNDTVKAYSKVTVSGRVVDGNGNTLPEFNGNIYPSVYDKSLTINTLENDPNSDYFEFDVQKNILFKGNASVKNGCFDFTFIVPKDINFSYGNGKISYYAKESAADASGYFDGFILGGIDENGLRDSIGPEVEVFLNDFNFVNHGTVDPNPILILRLTDDYGINTTGNGIGHDIVAVLDEATESPITLNDYYEAVQDSYNCGVVRYPLKDLAPGKHTLKCRAWDIANNATERTIEFQVISDAGLEISHLLNYPNPFTTHTDFYFEQNQPGGVFDIIIQVFTISGKIVKTISTQQYIEGNRCAAIPWDGRDDYGDKIGKGVYMYRLKIRNQEGKITEKIEKLVIL